MIVRDGQLWPKYVASLLNKRSCVGRTGLKICYWMSHSETGGILSKYKIHYRINKSAPLKTTLIQSNPAHMTHKNKSNQLILI